MEFKLDIWKILTTLASTGLIFAFGWIIKVEVNMTQSRAELSQHIKAADVELSQIRKEVDDLEDDVKTLRTKAQSSEVNYATLNANVKSILDKVNEIQKSLKTP